MATITQTKLVGFCLGNKTNYNATAYANHIWFDPTNKQILLNGIEYIPKKLSELVNDKNFLTSITKAMVENVLTGNITSHTHSYLSLSGGTMSNTNLVTNLNADLLDGYHASSFYKHATAYPHGRVDKTWHKIATFSQSTHNAQINTSVAFYVSEFYSSRSYGIFTVRARAEANSASLSFLTVDFLVNAGIPTTQIVATSKNAGDNNIVINVYAFRSGWSSFSFRKIEEQAWGEPSDKWVTLNAINGNENCYASIPSDENQVISTNIDINNNVATATALTSSAGSATQPVYFSGGKPVACTYTLAKSVPSNAVFTDTTYSVATASADGLMSSAMFKAQMVKSVGIKQGAEMMKPDGTITITDHRVYITQDKSNINGVYQQASGENDVKIPNATKDYDGSMSYTDKIFLEALKNISRGDSVYERTDNSMKIESAMEYGGITEVHYWNLPMATTSLCGLMTGTDKRKLDGISPYAPKKVVALRLSYTHGSVTVIRGGGDYDMTQDAELMQSASSDGVEEDYNGIHYLTTFSLDTAASSTDTLTNLFNNSFVKFSFMGKDTSYVPDTVDVKSSFDGNVLYVVFSSLDSQETWVVDCVWEFF